ncbi:dGTPase [Noviherbaspirillum galbum]|uniref:dGTPase n=1 Tax=Noviherbaspirillum galbum TaxID=2709383 RepID=A0A6B3SIF3_9BURK|nr:dGTPase [Noviherbaspirillum galbum]NEX60634.1 dGTPase [Noviherbaspirillum galbum]
MDSKTAKKVDYIRLLSATRRRESRGPSTRTLAMHAASDRGRVLFSTAFRRLQSKTQVFPQEWNAAVRTRLTHSLEVASIGRYVAEQISVDLLRRGELGERPRDMANAFVTFVEVACLMHDLGNPPFGHFGEASIQEWFSTRAEVFKEKFDPSVQDDFDTLFQDFSHFDGNPQGFRLAVRLQWAKDEFGYNLTLTQLAALLKYPWTPDRIGATQDGVTIKKAGVFHSEAEILTEIQTTLGLAPNCRHPLTYIMEAADDISYCLSDIEDALEKKVVRDQDVITALRQGLSELPTSNRLAQQMLNTLPDSDASEIDSAWFTDFRTASTNILVKRTRTLYSTSQKEIEQGKYFSLLRNSPAARALLTVVEKFSKKNLYTCSVVRERELVGYQVISGILDKFGILLELDTKSATELLVEGKPPRDKGMALAPTLWSFLPKKHLKVYAHTIEGHRTTFGEDHPKYRLLEWMARAHLIVDFLSGMTDDFSIVTYRRLYDGGTRQL